MGEHQSKAGVVADGADIAEVVGEALELRHQSAQPNGARRNFDSERRFHSAGKGEAIGDRAVAGGPRRERAAAVDRGAQHEGFDALMGVAQTLFEPDHRLAIRGKTEMARLDDPGMHRPNRDLMQAFALGRKEPVRFPIALRLGLLCQRVAQLPAAMIEPGPPVGQPHGVKADRDRGARAQAGSRAGAAVPQTENARQGTQWSPRRYVLALVEDRHVDRRHLSPKAEQGPAALGQPRRQELPETSSTTSPRARPMPSALRPLAISPASRRHLWLFLFAARDAIGPLSF